MASILAILAGLLGLAHRHNETLQGHASPIDVLPQWLGLACLGLAEENTQDFGYFMKRKIWVFFLSEAFAVKVGFTHNFSESSTVMILTT